MCSSLRKKQGICIKRRHYGGTLALNCTRLRVSLFMIGIFRDCIKAWNLIRDDKSMILSWCSLSSFLRYVHFLLLSRFCFTWFLFVLTLYMYCYSWNIFMNDIFWSGKNWQNVNIIGAIKKSPKRSDVINWGRDE